jgi:phosphatidylglycerophosphatase A
MRGARTVATLGGIGLLRPAPGSWASAAMLPAAWLGPEACLLFGLLLALAGLWAVWRLSAELDSVSDPPWIVVDEGAGMLLTLAALPPGAPWPWLLAAFALFRVFDILKPGPVGWADRRSGPVWVMLDDILAGTLAAALLLGWRWAWEGFA